MPDEKDRSQNEEVTLQDDATPVEEESPDEESSSTEDSTQREETSQTKAKEKPSRQQEELEEDEEDELGGSMTFLEHLTELRERLIRALAAFAVCTVICFMFSEQLLKILMAPLPEANKSQIEDTLKLWEKAFVERKNPSSENKEIDSATQTITAATSEVVSATSALEELKGLFKRESLQSIHPFEGILAWVKVSVIAGIFFAFPFMFYEAWMFIAPGLYKREKKVVLPMVLSAWFCFIVGGCFCYFIIYGFILQFLYFFNPEGVLVQWSLSNYISTTTRFMLAFGLIFEEPVVITLLAKIGLVTVASLRKFRPYAIVIMFVLSALITPPDPFSQLSCALPLYLLYEISIVVVRIIEKRKSLENGEAYSG